MEDVILKDGSSVPLAVVSTTMILLTDLIQSRVLEDMMLLYDLAEVAKGTKTTVSTFCVEAAYKCGLADGSGAVHGSVIQIVRSAIKSDAKGITLSNPVDLQKKVPEKLQGLDA